MAIRNYETLYIVRPELKDGEIQKIADKFKKVVEDKGGKVASAEKWEKRKLAYEIAGLKEGNYVMMHFESEGDVPAELNRLMRISDDVVRHMITSKEA
ncbi:MAG: 30S ribosomal protein S6 [Armatimonadota bacterium]